MESDRQIVKHILFKSIIIISHVEKQGLLIGNMEIVLDLVIQLLMVMLV